MRGGRGKGVEKSGEYEKKGRENDEGWRKGGSRGRRERERKKCRKKGRKEKIGERRGREIWGRGSMIERRGRGRGRVKNESRGRREGRKGLSISLSFTSYLTISYRNIS
jgi:hypothetical protein